MITTLYCGGLEEEVGEQEIKMHFKHKDKIYHTGRVTSSLTLPAALLGVKQYPSQDSSKMRTMAQVSSKMGAMARLSSSSPTS